MSSAEWVDLQTALLWTFGPLVHWAVAAFVALGFGAGAWIIWLGLLQWLSKTD